MPVISVVSMITGVVNVLITGDDSHPVVCLHTVVDGIVLHLRTRHLLMTPTKALKILTVRGRESRRMKVVGTDRLSRRVKELLRRLLDLHKHPNQQPYQHPHKP